jgi:competence protein ComEC
VPDDQFPTPPAAAPLIAIVAALCCAPAIQDVQRVAALLLLAAVALLLTRLAGRHRIAITAVILAVAVLRAGDAARRTRAVDALTRSLDGTRFVTTVAPIDRQWTFNGRSYTLLVSRFRVAQPAESSPVVSPSSRDSRSGPRFGHPSVPATSAGPWTDEPLRIISSSAPPPIADATEVVARGFLTRSEDGLRTVSIKSARLISYRGHLSPLDPRTLNRHAFVSAERYALGHPDSADSVALASALALGRSELLSDALRDAYRRAGTYHFLVFSGLQVAAAAAAVAFVGRRRGRPRRTSWLLLLLAVVIVLFAGMTPSLIRACGCLAVFAISRILKRPTPLDNLLLITAGAQLLARPVLLTDAGFQLTYAGAGAIILVVQPLLRDWSIRSRLVKAMVAATAAGSAVAPLTLFHFHQYSVGGLVLLPLLAPLVALMLLLSVAALTAICAGAAVAAPLLAALALLDRLCLAANSGARGPFHLSGFAMAPTTGMMVAGYGLALLAVALAGPRVRAIVMLAGFLLPLVLTAHRNHSLATVRGARLEALDVGQGDALLLRAGSSAMLLDGGGRADDWRFGERRLLPMLLDRGIRHLDVVALSHAHPDHCGGLPAVIDEIPVSEVWLSPRRFRGPCAQEILAACERSAVPVRLVLHDEDRMAGSIPIRALPPLRNYRRSPENNSSVVYLARLGGRRVLLTGDIERDGEEALMRRGADLQADVLKVAHHGSRTSTTPAILDRIHPRLALISCGYRNSFGHPHQDVIKTLSARGINTLRTDLSGCIRIDFSDRKMLSTHQFDTPR